MSTRDALVTVAIFAVIGPAIGAVALGVFLALASPLLGEAEALGSAYLRAAIVLLPMAYVAGGVQAVATGTATAAWALQSMRPPIWQVPFFAAGIAGMVYVVLIGAGTVALLPFAIVAAHVVAGLACWKVCAYLLGWSRAG